MQSQNYIISILFEWNCFEISFKSQHFIYDIFSTNILKIRFRCDSPLDMTLSVFLHAWAFDAVSVFHNRQLNTLWYMRELQNDDTTEFLLLYNPRDSHFLYLCVCVCECLFFMYILFVKFTRRRCCLWNIQALDYNLLKFIPFTWNALCNFDATATSFLFPRYTERSSTRFRFSFSTFFIHNNPQAENIKDKKQFVELQWWAKSRTVYTL